MFLAVLFHAKLIPSTLSAGECMKCLPCIVMATVDGGVWCFHYGRCSFIAVMICQLVWAIWVLISSLFVSELEWEVKHFPFCLKFYEPFSLFWHGLLGWNCVASHTWFTCFVRFLTWDCQCRVVNTTKPGDVSFFSEAPCFLSVFFVFPSSLMPSVHPLSVSVCLFVCLSLSLPLLLTQFPLTTTSIYLSIFMWCYTAISFFFFLFSRAYFQTWHTSQWLVNVPSLLMNCLLG